MNVLQVKSQPRGEIEKDEKSTSEQRNALL
jgi:hypothetical protein